MSYGLSTPYRADWSDVDRTTSERVDPMNVYVDIYEVDHALMGYNDLIPTEWSAIIRIGAIIQR